MPTYVMTLRCADAPGIVRATSAAIVMVDGNILENDQFTDPVTEQFCMRTRFETHHDDIDAVRATLVEQLTFVNPLVDIRLEEQRRRILVYVSKDDHCLAELLYRQAQGDVPVEIVAIVSNHPDCGDLARRYAVDFYEIAVNAGNKVEAESAVRTLISNHDVDFIVLARYMQILSPEFCQDFPGRIINIHHSFLPGFKGARPYHQAYERGVKLIGATAHFVTANLDEGPIIEQDVVRVSHARTPKELISLGRDIERSVLTRAVKLVAEDRVTIVGNRTVVFSQ